MNKKNLKTLIILFVIIITAILPCLKNIRVLYDKSFLRPDIIKAEKSTSCKWILKTNCPQEEHLMYFSKDSTQWGKLLQNTLTYQPKPSGYIEVLGGYIGGRYGLVLDKSRKLIEETASVLIKNNAQRHKIWKPLNSQKSKKIQGTTLLITGNYSNCYYHWMCDIIPKLKLVSDFHIQYDNICVPKTLSKFQAETLSFFFNSNVKFVYADESLMECEKIVIPFFETLVVFGKNQKSYQNYPWAIKFLEKYVPDSSEKISEEKIKIFISRSKATKRKLTNEDEVLAILKDFGFTKIFLEDLSVQSQKRMFANSSHIIAVHGAGLTNLVFCKEKTKVIEIFPRSAFFEKYPANDEFSLYPRICQMKKLNHFYIMGENEKNWLAQKRVNKNNVKINLEDFKSLVKEVLNEEV